MHNPLERTEGDSQPCGDRLRGLPAEALPPYNWQEFQRRSLVSARGAPQLNWRHMSAAAAVLLIVCGVAVWGRWGRGVHDGETRESAPPLASNQAIQVRPFDLQTDSRSQAIESWLATLPREPVVVRVGTRTDVARLEDRIAQVDDLMTSVRLNGMRPDRLAALQKERFQLVGSLAQLRYAEVVAAESP